MSPIAGKIVKQIKATHGVTLIYRGCKTTPRRTSKIAGDTGSCVGSVALAVRRKSRGVEVGAQLWAALRRGCRSCQLLCSVVNNLSLEKGSFEPSPRLPGALLGVAAGGWGGQPAVLPSKTTLLRLQPTRGRHGVCHREPGTRETIGELARRSTH